MRKRRLPRWGQALHLRPANAASDGVEMVNARLEIFGFWTRDFSLSIFCICICICMVSFWLSHRFRYVIGFLRFGTILALLVEK